MKYCSECGAPVALQVPPGDDRPRYVCEKCKTIHYENPTLVVGCIPEYQGKILLCLRAIQPRYGKWTLPAGFLENGETLIQGAEREAFEEARAKVDGMTPYAIFNLIFINQVYLMFRCRLCDPDVLPGRESLRVKLFAESEIPWNQMAFPVIRETLQLYFQDREAGVFPVHMGDIRLR